MRRGESKVDEFYCEIGRRIKAEREELGFTQLDLAREIGLQRTSVANIEVGRQHAPLHILCAIAEALGVPVGCLLPTSEEMSHELS